MTPEKMIETVKKLLALASSPIKGEAELAYKKAQELIARYSLDLSEENKIEDIVTIVYEPNIKIGPGLSVELPFIIQSISLPFGVHVLVTSHLGIIKLVGFKTNVLIATHACDCILSHCYSEYKEGFKRSKSMTFGINFWRGVRFSLYERFTPKNEVGLTIYDPVKKFMEQFGVASVRTSFAMGTEGLKEGHSSGKNAQIRPGLTTSSKGRLLS